MDRSRPLWLDYAEIAQAKLRRNRPDAACDHLKAARSLAPLSVYRELRTISGEVTAGRLENAVSLLDALLESHSERRL